MILYIAEKPSLARAIAAAMPGPQKKQDGCIWLANGDCISWCIGHLLEQAEPHQYNPCFKSWQLEHLPIIPQEWQWQEKKQTKKQFSILKKLIKQADQLVHAGDPDREGQLLVDEVLHHTKVPKGKLHNTKRLLISDLTPKAVKKALASLRANSEFSALSRSALARARADWLFGLNLTRSYTIQGRQAGYNGVLSIGRVQTPVLGLVVRRDIERENFVAKDFYQVWAEVHTQQGHSFSAKWLPSEHCKPYMDEEGRILSRPLAENVATRIQDKPAQLVEAKYQDKQQTPPLPYNLSSLQIDAAKVFSLSAQQVLDTCQSLYEKHQVITYPRSDCRYLPKGQHSEASSIIKALSIGSEALAQSALKAKPARKSKAWNDAKVTAHHAIIPTSQAAKVKKLSSQEQNVFYLIARQYLMQFLDNYEYLTSEILLSIEGGKFLAKGHTPKALGWKEVLPQKTAKSDEDAQPQLPFLTESDTLWCQQGKVIEKTTTPPPAFTDATLLAAMTGISRFVQDTNIKAVLKETDGLGTEATRAGIIELLFKRGFLTRQGKQIHASSTGRAFANCLSEALTTPDMTAQWEAKLNAMSLDEISYQSFMNELTSSLHTLLNQSQTVSSSALRALPAAPSKAKARKYKRNPTTGKRSKAAKKSN
ncbi:DNA topoisomerase III [Marinomonas epiphytica]